MARSVPYKKVTFSFSFWIREYMNRRFFLFALLTILLFYLLLDHSHRFNNSSSTSSSSTTSSSPSSSFPVGTPPNLDHISPSLSQSNEPSCLDLTTGKPLSMIHRYAVVIDAGSTGTRLHVYELLYCGSRVMKLLSEVFEEVPIGLATLADQLHLVLDKIIRPLMRVALQHVPNEKVSCSPVALKATAGLRLLSKDKSAALLEKVRSGIEEFPFPFSENRIDSVSVIHGTEEGVWGWITVNFLLNKIGYLHSLDAKRSDESKEKLSNGKTAAVMDLGGASTQIVFEMDPKEIEYYRLHAPSSPYLYPLRFDGQNYTLFQHSFLGFGLMEARKRIKSAFLKSLIKSDPSGASAPFSCFSSGYSEQFEMEQFVDSSSLQKGPNNGVSVPPILWVNGTLNGADAHSCRAHVRSIFSFDSPCALPPCSFNGIPHPSSFHSLNDIYAFSYFYDRTTVFSSLGALTSDGPQLKLGELWKHTTDLCHAVLTPDSSQSKDGSIAKGSSDGLPIDPASTGPARPPNRKLTDDKSASPTIKNPADAEASLPHSTHPIKEKYIQALSSNPQHCLDLVYIHTLLKEGYGLEDSKPIHIVKKINGIETCWALGAAIHMLDSFQGCPEDTKA